jgi:multisubunit Na+/H+ antiporter MnhB subunit
LYVNNTDTIRITVTNEVEKPIAPFVRNSCIALWVIVGVAFLSLVVWIVWKFATGKISWIEIITKLFKLKK